MATPNTTTRAVEKAQARLAEMAADIEQNYRQDPNEALATMALAVLDAEDFESMFDTQSVEPASDLFNVGLHVTEITFNKSAYDEGLPYFATMRGTKVSDGSNFVANCGAWQAVVVCYNMVKKGYLPKTIQFKRSERPTAQGFYPINILPWDEPF